VLDNWIATAPLSMNTPHGMSEIMPGHRVSVPVARILNAWRVLSITAPLL
jgi:hypothetical protein